MSTPAGRLRSFRLQCWFQSQFSRDVVNAEKVVVVVVAVAAAGFVVVVVGVVVVVVVVFFVEEVVQWLQRHSSAEFAFCLPTLN